MSIIPWPRTKISAPPSIDDLTDPEKSVWLRRPIPERALLAVTAFAVYMLTVAMNISAMKEGTSFRLRMGYAAAVLGCSIVDDLSV